MLTTELRNNIDKIWETFWTGGIANPLTVIEQITYLLFIKRLDEEQQRLEAENKLIGTTIDKPIYTKKEKELRWNSFKDLEPQTMFDLFRQVDGVFDFMRNYGEKDSAFGKFMKGAVFMIPTPRLLANVVDMLSSIDMKDRDTKGDVYEYLLSKIASAGTNGQFRTPRHIIKMMVQMMKPSINDIIADPSAGTCGFLVGAAEYIKEHNKTSFYDKKFQKKFSKHMFTGMEFDPTMIRIGAMNMILHGIEEPVLYDVDALSEANTAFSEKATIVLANPPFTGSLDKDTVDAKLTKVVDSRKTELLFMALILKGLKKGGRAAVIIPDGVLFGSSKAHLQIRKEIIDNHKLDAIISMPGGVFKPYAGVSTAIVIFTKTTTGGTDKVWFYDMKADGYTLDDKRHLTKENDIADILHRWDNLPKETKRKKTEQSFFIPVKEIVANNYDLSINRYKEVIHEEKIYAKPEIIIDEIKNLDKERNTALKALEKLLG
jgi:type I restriction enzyme M protein